MISVNNFSAVKKQNLLPKYQPHYNTIKNSISSGLYQEDKDVRKIIDAILNEVNNKIRAQKNGKTKKPKKQKDQDAEMEKSVLNFPLSEINTDEKRFQNRSRLNENTIFNIVENYSPTQLDPLIVWKDEKDGKTFLLAGHHRFEALKRLNKKTAPVKFANKDFPTEKDAIKYARQLSNANRTLEQPHERAKIYHEMRLNGESKNVIDKAAQIEGKNRSYILNLSYLNPTGPVAESLTRFEGATDKDSSAKVEKIADWIGQARRQNEKLTDSHETEMFKFLNDVALSKRISSKADFLQKITSITGDMFFNYKDPLNLAKFKYQTEGEKVYDAEVEEIKEEISQRQRNIDEIKQRFLNPSNKSYINPDAKDYHQAKSIADERISEYNFEIQELQKKLQQIYQNKGKYVNAGSNQVGLFGSRKKRKKRNTGALGSPAANPLSQDPITPEPFIPAHAMTEKPTRAKNLAVAMQERSNSPVIVIPGDLGRFLGQVEIKPVHSVVTTLDAEQGSGKTRFFFQVMNALAGMGRKCLFYSLEEHPASKLFKDKVDQYIEPRNLKNIAVIDEVMEWSQEKELIKAHDAIFVDSFQKLPPNLDLDRDIRKAFDGKWFFIIYQQTGTKGMRGGSKAAFDGDQILKVAKDSEDYRENYVYTNKNRYNDAPDLKFNIYTDSLVKDPESEPEFKQHVSSEIPPDAEGRLIATPII